MKHVVSPMPRLFTAVYLVDNGRRHATNPTTAASAFYVARQQATFPFDAGDDPSFFASSYCGGPLTWGVCRLDVRRQLQKGDWVTFFSQERIAEKVQYKFCAAVRVQAKHLHWSLPAKFVSYLNMLVSSNSYGYSHHEPVLHTTDWHTDWLWRMSAGRAGRKSALETRGRIAVLQTLFDDGADIPACGNYIEFEQVIGFRHPSPPVVATWCEGMLTEKWLPGALALRSYLFGPSSARWLRTSNPSQPHRHTRRVIAEPDFLRGLAAAMPV